MTVTDTDLCPGTNRFPVRIQRGGGYRRPFPGICPECGQAVPLLTSPDAGPEGVIDEHPRSTP